MLHTSETGGEYVHTHTHRPVIFAYSHTYGNQEPTPISLIQIQHARSMPAFLISTFHLPSQTLRDWGMFSSARLRVFLVPMCVPTSQPYWLPACPRAPAQLVPDRQPPRTPWDPTLQCHTKPLPVNTDRFLPLTQECGITHLKQSLCMIQ